VADDVTAPVVWETKIAVVLRDDLLGWQKLNVACFTVSGIAATVKDVVGEPYVDGSENTYLPMFQQPVLVFLAGAEKLRQVYERALRREVSLSIYPEDLFGTNNDEDNRATIRDVDSGSLRLAGLAVHGDRRTVDRIVKGSPLHP
jgi:hypothetical protein